MNLMLPPPQLVTVLPYSLKVEFSEANFFTSAVSYRAEIFKTLVNTSVMQALIIHSNGYSYCHSGWHEPTSVFYTGESY